MTRSLARLALILGLLLALASTAEATWATVQKVDVTGSTVGATSIAVTVANTGSGHVLVACYLSGMDNQITSITSAETWTDPGFHGFATGTAGVDCWYVLNSTGGNTTITINFAADSSGFYAGAVYEFSYSHANGNAVFDTGAAPAFSTSQAADPPGVLLTLTGANDAIVQTIQGNTNPTAINLSYTYNAITFGWAMADLINTNSGAAPTWTAAVSGNNWQTSALAFKEAVGGAPPGTPTSPNPANNATGVSTVAALTWSASGATSYNIDFGTANPPPSAATGLGAATYSPSMAALTVYYWRVHAINANGTTDGPVWSFQTEVGGGGGGNTYYIDAASSDCANATGSGTIQDPWHNLYNALTFRSFPAGALIYLRGGTYRNTYNAFAASCNMPGDTSGINTVLPLTIAGTSGSPIIIQNYAGETVIIDGSNARFIGATWTACGGGMYTLNQAINVGSAYTGQVWFNPSGANSSGTRLRYAGSGGCSGLAEGTFAWNGNGTALAVRLQGSADPNGANLRVACQAGDCATYPINDAVSANYVTVRKNPSGGTFAVMYGYYSVRIDNGGQNLVFDGIDILAAGGRDYGSCVRVYFGNNITFKNGTCKETSGEGMQFYGGGPGGANGGGIQLTGNIIQNWATSFTGFSVEDGGGNGNNLGMSYIYKNCSNCKLLNSTASGSFASCLEVTTSTDVGETDAIIVDGNNFSDCGYINPAVGGGRTRACIDVQPQRSVTGGAVRNGVYKNNMCHNDTFGSGATWSGSFGGGTVYGLNMSDGGWTGMTGNLVVNNSFDYFSGPGLNLMEVGQPITFRNNAFGGNLSTGGNVCNGNGACDVMLSVASNTHSNNTYWASAAGTQVVYTNGGSNYTRTSVTGYEASAVQSNPLFISPGNLHLQTGSPMIGAATSTNAPSTDIDGQTRPISGTYDIGADEFGTGGGGGGGSGVVKSRRSSSPLGTRAGSRGGVAFLWYWRF